MPTPVHDTAARRPNLTPAAERLPGVRRGGTRGRPARGHPPGRAGDGPGTAGGRADPAGTQRHAVRARCGRGTGAGRAADTVRARYGRGGARRAPYGCDGNGGHAVRTVRRKRRARSTDGATGTAETRYGRCGGRVPGGPVPPVDRCRRWTGARTGARDAGRRADGRGAAEAGSPSRRDAGRAGHIPRVTGSDPVTGRADRSTAGRDAAPAPPAYVRPLSPHPHHHYRTVSRKRGRRLPHPRCDTEHSQAHGRCRPLRGSEGEPCLPTMTSRL